MLPLLKDIRSAIEAGNVLPPDKIAALDHDAILDARDEKAFSDKWMQSYNTVNEAWSQITTAAGIDSQIDDIRRESFMVVSNSTDQHEIASYVSDDFELIAKAAVTETEDPLSFRCGLPTRNKLSPTQKTRSCIQCRRA